MTTKDAFARPKYIVIIARLRQEDRGEGGFFSLKPTYQGNRCAFRSGAANGVCSTFSRSARILIEGLPFPPRRNAAFYAGYCMVPFICTGRFLRHLGQKKCDWVIPVLMSMVLRQLSSNPHAEHFLR